jgi:hypothetical protein
MVLRIRWPKLAARIDDDPSLLEILERRAVERAPSFQPPADGPPENPEVLRLVHQPDESLRISRLPLEGVLRVA